jgi:hypothetical protein
MTNDRRTDKRFFLHSQVEITGADGLGFQFAERSHLEDVGDLGCRFSMRNVVHQGSILGVEPLGPEGQNFPDEYSRLFVVVWVKCRADRLMVGTRCLLEDELSDSGCHTDCSPSKVSAE